MLGPHSILSAEAAPFIPLGLQEPWAHEGHGARKQVIALADALEDLDAEGRQKSGMERRMRQRALRAKAGKPKAYSQNFLAVDAPPGLTAPWKDSEDGRQSLQPEKMLQARQGKATRAAVQLRQLLDFYFEPFNFQHNRYLLDLVVVKLGLLKTAEAGPWFQEVLRPFAFDIKELQGLGRVAKALELLRAYNCQVIPPRPLKKDNVSMLTCKMGAEVIQPVTSDMKQLVWTARGQLALRSPAEVRSFVGAKNANAEELLMAKRHMRAVKKNGVEIVNKAPPRTMSFCSYCIGDVMSAEGESLLNSADLKGGKPKSSIGPMFMHRQAQIKRQLAFYKSDVICVQGSCVVDGEASHGILSALYEEGFNCIYAKDELTGEANSIFWETSRVEMQNHQVLGSAVAADFRLLEDDAPWVRAVCMKPALPTTDNCLASLFAQKADSPIVVCMNAEEIGGAEASTVVEETMSMRSLAEEVLGEEVAVPLAFPTSSGVGATPVPVTCAASGLNLLHCPDGIFYKSLEPVMTLSGHSERYLATLPPEDIVQQFPAFRLPLLGVFRV